MFPSFGDFYFDPLMPIDNPYAGKDVHYGPRHLTRETAARFWTQPDKDALLGDLDIVHGNNFWCPTYTPASRLIYTFYDMGFAIDPAWTTEKNREGCFRGVFHAAIVADWIVAISEASRSHYLEVFPSFPADRIRVIHPCSRFADGTAMGTRPAALKEVAEGRFWLSVGTIEPRKNQRRLTDAYARYRASTANPMPLVLAGGKGWLMDDFQSHLVELGIQQHVVLTGYVSDAELIWLYRHCYANLYPSLFEGFGLPVLEGMQFGAATVASDNTSLPEVAGNAAILLEATDIDAWAGTLVRLGADERERGRLQAAALAQAATFEWKTSAAALLRLYEDALAAPKRRQ